MESSSKVVQLRTAIYYNIFVQSFFQISLMTRYHGYGDGIQDDGIQDGIQDDGIQDGIQEDGIRDGIQDDGIQDDGIRDGIQDGIQDDGIQDQDDGIRDGIQDEDDAQDVYRDGVQDQNHARHVQRRDGNQDADDAQDVHGEGNQEADIAQDAQDDDMDVNKVVWRERGLGHGGNAHTFILIKVDDSEIKSEILQVWGSVIEPLACRTLKQEFPGTGPS